MQYSEDPSDDAEGRAAGRGSGAGASKVFFPVARRAVEEFEIRERVPHFDIGEKLEEVGISPEGCVYAADSAAEGGGRGVPPGGGGLAQPGGCGADRAGARLLRAIARCPEVELDLDWHTAGTGCTLDGLRVSFHLYSIAWWSYYPTLEIEPRRGWSDERDENLL